MGLGSLRLFYVLCVVATCISTLHTDTFLATIYWDLGGDVTQYGSPEAIGDLVVAQSKVLPFLDDDKTVSANAPRGSDRRPGHLGSRRYFYPRLDARPLHPDIPD